MKKNLFAATFIVAVLTSVIVSVVYISYEYAINPAMEKIASADNEQETTTENIVNIVEEAPAPTNTLENSVMTLNGKEWRFIAATAVYDYTEEFLDSKGAFKMCLVFKGEEAWKIYVSETHTSCQPKQFKEFDYSFNKIPENWKINSAILGNGKWLPALLTGGNDGDFTYCGSDESIVTMNKHFAWARYAYIVGDYQFNEESSLFLNVSYQNKNGQFVVKNHHGKTIFTIKNT